jgi:glycosyltransferase involved in cell wall biosynthesis
MQFPGTIARALSFADGPGFDRRVFASREANAAPRFGGLVLPPATGLADFVADTLRAAAFDPDRTLAWVCPVVRNFAAIDRRLAFRWVVADLIDDERSGTIGPDQLTQLQAEYEQILQRADVVLTNAEGNRDRFASMRSDIHVIPNGAELEPPPADLAPPAFMTALRHPTIGYVGNLRDRIDWPLISTLAQHRPDWDFVLIGPWEEQGVPTEIRTLANVKLPGPLPYEVGRVCLRLLDCAIVPHTKDAMTDAMNPLKVYNYLAAGLPVVTTAIGNLHSVQDLVTVADGAEGFASAIDAALLARKSGWRPPIERLRPLSWQSRTTQILALLEGLEARSAPEPG